MKKFKKHILPLLGAAAILSFLTYVVIEEENRRQAFLDERAADMVWTRSDTNGTHTFITRYKTDGTLVSAFTVKEKTITIKPDFKNMTVEQIQKIHEEFRGRH